MIISDEEFSSLEWAPLSALDLQKETEGYIITDTDTCIECYTDSGEPSISFVWLYLSRPGDTQIKIIQIEANFINMYGEAKDNESPLKMAIAYAQRY